MPKVIYALQFFARKVCLFRSAKEPAKLAHYACKEFDYDITAIWEK